MRDLNPRSKRYERSAFGQAKLTAQKGLLLFRNPEGLNRATQRGVVEVVEGDRAVGAELVEVADVQKGHDFRGRSVGQRDAFSGVCQKIGDFLGIGANSEVDELSLAGDAEVICVIHKKDRLNEVLYKVNNKLSFSTLYQREKSSLLDVFSFV